MSIRGGLLVLASMLIATCANADLIGQWELDGDAVATTGSNGTIFNGAAGTDDRFGNANG